MKKICHNHCFIILFPLYYFYFALFKRATEEPIPKYAVIGSNFTISCETTTNVPFKWSKDNVNITESNNRLVPRAMNISTTTKQILQLMLFFYLFFIKCQIPFID